MRGTRQNSLYGGKGGFVKRVTTLKEQANDSHKKSINNNNEEAQ